jgi:hypothetical protein
MKISQFFVVLERFLNKSNLIWVCRGIAEIFKNINEWFFTRVSKEERKEVSESLLGKVRQLMTRTYEIAKRFI